MKFGAHLPSYWDDYGASNMQFAVVEAAKAAEALGYDALWANDKTRRSR
jgi:alkanesulfonate monooxygenase SsuD/methylene tetrahydromethanopterin reductase-like flavin-dependent oxidoreductase (luciferase family)